LFFKKKHLNKAAEQKIHWYRSIQFKIFLVLFAIVSVTVSGISYQNIQVFKQDMELQVQYELSNEAQRMSSTIEGLLDVWASCTYVLMHSIDKAAPQILRDQVSAVLTSNKEIIAVKFLKWEKNNKETLVNYQFTPHLNSFHFGKGSSSSAELKNRLQSSSSRNGGQKKPLTNGASQNKPYIELQNDISGLQIVTLRTPFRIKGNGAAYEAVLYLWSDRLTAALSKGPNTLGILINSSDQVLAKSINRNDDLMQTLVTSSQKSKNTIEVQNGPSQLVSQRSQSKIYASSQIKTYGLQLKLVQDVTQAFKYLENRVLKLAVVAWGLVVLSSGGVYLGIKGTIQSIIDVEHVALDISKGDFAARVKIKRKDEIGLLGSAINQMAFQIGELFAVKQLSIRQEIELKMAQEVQLTLLPRTVTRGALNAKGFYRSASECAGDYWNVLQISPSKTLVVIADVVGHGAHSALLVAVAHGFFEHYAQGVQENASNEVPLNTLFSQLNRVLWNSGEGKNNMTLFGTLFDSASETLISCGAGHVFPFHLTPKKQEPEFSSSESNTSITSICVPGNVIGANKDCKFDLKSEPFKKGERLVLFTDGLFECKNAEGQTISKMNFRKKLASELQKPIENSFERVVNSINEHFGSMHLDDDITFVMIEHHKETPALSGLTPNNPEFTLENAAHTGLAS
jgi:serine phosphatase RsbU (regulator of sigma subunit)